MLSWNPIYVDETEARACILFWSPWRISHSGKQSRQKLHHQASTGGRRMFHQSNIQACPQSLKQAWISHLAAWNQMPFSPSLYCQKFQLMLVFQTGWFLLIIMSPRPQFIANDAVVSLKKQQLGKYQFCGLLTKHFFFCKLSRPSLYLYF